MDQDKLESIRATLEAERARVAHQLEEMGAAADSEGVVMSVDEGFADSAQATMERSELLSLVDELRTLYAEVTAALERAANGTLGKCANCGEEIPTERLEALPTANLCVGCKQSASN